MPTAELHDVHGRGREGVRPTSDDEPLMGLVLSGEALVRHWTVTRR